MSPRSSNWWVLGCLKKNARENSSGFKYAAVPRDPMAKPNNGFDIFMQYSTGRTCVGARDYATFYTFLFRNTNCIARQACHA